MLVLSRKLNEAIQIGDDIEIKVLGVEGDQVKLGISAPNHVEIHRQEIYAAIQEENSEAATFQADLLNLLKNQQKR
ncbi:carbon storage regulator CsrA [Thalassobacillus sp. CUG 92003]|uniref:carbon storage regulator CsrA n=1 Tax=Thalassobacillus sp. CUG 92003 TaxID=2736641 RepID=UPI0015E6CC1C|nr:carbon storage regulator CsrA [Thalassobacillus sp. CUG 92003]